MFKKEEIKGNTLYTVSIYFSFAEILFVNLSIMAFVLLLFWDITGQ